MHFNASSRLHSHKVSVCLCQKNLRKLFLLNENNFEVEWMLLSNEICFGWVEVEQIF